MTKKKKYRNPSNRNGAPHPLYQCFKNMYRRCYEEKNKSYKSYGARGIKVCDQWKDNFDAFADFAKANGWKEGRAIVLKNEDNDYKPGNIEFVSRECVLGRTFKAGSGYGVRRNRRTVINIAQRKMYPSIRAAAFENGGFENSLSRAIRKCCKYKDSYWMYADPKRDIDEQILEFRVEPKPKAVRGAPLRNITAGRVFPSVKAAAEAYNISPASIHSALRNRTRAAEAYWERITVEVYRLLS